MRLSRSGDPQGRRTHAGPRVRAARRPPGRATERRWAARCRDTPRARGGCRGKVAAPAARSCAARCRRLEPARRARARAAAAQQNQSNFASGRMFWAKCSAVSSVRRRDACRVVNGDEAIPLHHSERHIHWDAQPRVLDLRRECGGSAQNMSPKLQRLRHVPTYIQRRADESHASHRSGISCIHTKRWQTPRQARSRLFSRQVRPRVYQ